MLELAQVTDLNPTSVESSTRQLRLTFPNGFGASVINDGYGGREGLYEVAVIDREGSVTYDTPVMDDVAGYLTADEAVGLLRQIAALPVPSLTEV